MERRDGPASRLFRTLPFAGNVPWEELGAVRELSQEMRAALAGTRPGVSVGWGIPWEPRWLIGRTGVYVSTFSRTEISCSHRPRFGRQRITAYRC